MQVLVHLILACSKILYPGETNLNFTNDKMQKEIECIEKLSQEGFKPKLLDVWYKTKKIKSHVAPKILKSCYLNGGAQIQVGLVLIQLQTQSWNIVFSLGVGMTSQHTISLNNGFSHRS